MQPLPAATCRALMTAAWTSTASELAGSDTDTLAAGSGTVHGGLLFRSNSMLPHNPCRALLHATAPPACLWLGSRGGSPSKADHARDAQHGLGLAPATSLLPLAACRGLQAAGVLPVPLPGTSKQVAPVTQQNKSTAKAASCCARSAAWLRHGAPASAAKQRWQPSTAAQQVF